MNTETMIRNLGVIQFSNSIKHDNVYPKVNVTYKLFDFLTDDNRAIVVDIINRDTVSITLRFNKKKFIEAKDHLMMACDNKGSAFKAYVIINENIKEDGKIRQIQTPLGNIRHLETLTTDMFEGAAVWCKFTLTRAKHKRYFQLLGLSTKKAFDRN